MKGWPCFIVVTLLFTFNTLIAEDKTLLNYRDAMLENYSQGQEVWIVGIVLQQADRNTTVLSTKITPHYDYIDHQEYVLIKSEKPFSLEGEMVGIITQYNGTISGVFVGGALTTVPYFEMMKVSEIVPKLEVDTGLDELMILAAFTEALEGSGVYSTGELDFVLIEDWEWIE